MQELRELKRENWPGLICDIAELIGDEAALSLFVQFAGQDLVVPKITSPDHIIDKTIGTEKSAEFRKIFGGEAMAFPSGKLLMNQQRNQQRNQQMMEELSGGMTKRGVAAKYGLTKRRVYQIVNECNS